MFFTHDRAWEEFFCVCIQLLNKTWKEMRATAEDFNKVLNDTLLAALSRSPHQFNRQTTNCWNEKCNGMRIGLQYFNWLKE